MCANEQAGSTIAANMIAHATGGLDLQQTGMDSTPPAIRFSVQSAPLHKTSFVLNHAARSIVMYR